MQNDNDSTGPGASEYAPGQMKKDDSSGSSSSSGSDQ
jgi:hypothetical protein